ncbi:MAG: hypothetical protein DRJ47_06765 [Thermoprotei archaeon]|nr:MAG: hypothetical protein DRJ47_06765 [Thermoprotei archaeon]
MSRPTIVLVLLFVGAIAALIGACGVSVGIGMLVASAIAGDLFPIGVAITAGGCTLMICGIVMVIAAERLA